MQTLISSCRAPLLQAPAAPPRLAAPPIRLGRLWADPTRGCDPNPLGRGFLPTTRTTSPSGPTYPSVVSADGHSAVWRNVTLSTIPVSLPLIGLVNYYQPILCLATVTPGSSAYSIGNPVISISYVSKNYVKEGLVYTNIIPPPPPPPPAPGTIVGQPGPAGRPGPPGVPGPAGVPGSYTGVPSSTTTLNVINVIIIINVGQPPCREGDVSDTRITNTSILVGNTTQCNTTEISTVTNTTTCAVPGRANVRVNTTTTTNTLCLPVVTEPPPVNVTGTPTPTPTNTTNITGTPTPTPTNMINITGTPTPFPTPTNDTLVPIPTPSNGTVITDPAVISSPLPTTRRQPRQTRVSRT
ncbi:hypothetical protein KFL_008080060 [Klebsormidium nitens]|uniref:Uncharacterized protein n=1 Tax=Klebsormidium nitens TaxID=105231 RepID=A0A1Y1IQ03_KLENI|nr:hypothetical protein KFL_008080060 [Klebsormidium nitens]|eukprot:GAQ91569.1 hypothetical protein KFL_008080060 [Klebsormidium nitens]